MGSVVSKKRKLKTKNVIPKDKDMPRVFDKILPRKDPDFDVLYFDINIDGFHPARVLLLLQNHPACPPTPEFSTTVLSLDSGYDCQ